MQDHTVGSQASEDEIRHSVSLDSELTCGGLSCGIEEELGPFTPLSGHFREARGRSWDFDADGKAPTISGRQ